MSCCDLKLEKGKWKHEIRMFRSEHWTGSASMRGRHALIFPDDNVEGFSPFIFGHASLMPKRCLQLSEPWFCFCDSRSFRGQVLGAHNIWSMHDA
jgi:hypothetical protein